MLPSIGLFHQQGTGDLVRQHILKWRSVGKAGADGKINMREAGEHGAVA